MKKGADLRARHDAMGLAERASFRAQFFGTEMEVAKEDLKAVRRLTISDKNTGTFMTPRKISIELGNDPRAASKYCMGCLRVGPSEYMIDV